MDRIIKSKKLSFSDIKVEISKIGDDYNTLLQGGSSPHIGCTVLAVPRPSIKDKNNLSCTASVMNVIGHKDEYICRLLAEEICCKVNSVVVCTGGFHEDDITPEQIKEVIDAIKEFIKEIISEIDLYHLTRAGAQMGAKNGI